MSPASIGGGSIIRLVEVYNPILNGWSSMPTLAALNDGQVLIELKKYNILFETNQPMRSPELNKQFGF